MSSVHAFFGFPETGRNVAASNGAGRGHMPSRNTPDHNASEETQHVASDAGDTFSPESDGLEAQLVHEGHQEQPLLVEDGSIRIDIEEPRPSGDGAVKDPLADIMEAWTGISGALPEEEADGSILDGETARRATATGIEAAREAPGSPTMTRMSFVGVEEPAPIPKDIPLQATMGTDGPVVEGAESSQQIHLQTAARDSTAIAEHSLANRLPAQQGTAAIQQVAEALVRMQGDRLEIALSPEELGRLRLVLSRQNGAPHILVWAERPEVLELMRRNADLLLEYFGEEGTGSPSLTFTSDGPQDEANPSQASESPEEHSDPPRIVTAVTASADGFGRLGGDRRIDIRV